MNLSEYKGQLQIWREMFPSILDENRIQFDPKKVKSTCAKCGKARVKMNRHHISNDYFFACILPEIYARRYLEFKEEDISLLCNKHHKQWHIYIKPKLKPMWDEYNNLSKQPIFWDKNKKWWAEKWRVRIKAWYIKWVNVAETKKKRKKSVNVSKK